MHAATSRVPGPRGNWLTGSLGPMRRDMLGFVQEVAYTHGPVASFRLGPQRVYLVTGPPEVEHVLRSNGTNYILNKSILAITQQLVGVGLGTSDGDYWRRSRKTLHSALGPQLFQKFLDAVLSRTQRELERWDVVCRAGTPIHLDAELRQLNLKIAGEALLGLDLEDSAAAIGRTIDNGAAYLVNRFKKLLALPMWVPTPYHLRLKADLQSLPRMLDDEIRRRRQSPSGGGELMNVLLGYQDPETGKSMPDDEIRNECLGMLVAGHETSTLALVWTLFLLGQHSATDQQVAAEARARFSEPTAAPAHIDELSLLKQVVQESMRLYPPTWALTRTSKAVDQVGDYTLPPKANILLSQYATHRHPELWPEPDRFLPERFAPEASKGRHPFAFFPFGGGPRICVARNIALSQIPLMLALILQRFRVIPIDLHKVRPDPTFSLRLNVPLICRLEFRDRRAAGAADSGTAAGLQGLRETV